MYTSRLSISGVAFLAAAFLAFLPGPASAQQETPSKAESIAGTVTDIETNNALVGANITILNRYGGTSADTSGHFVLRNLPAGIYRIRVSHVGYDALILDSLQVPSDASRNLEVQLHRRVVSIKGITVTPGVYSIASGEPIARQTLSRDEITTRPQVSEDLFRAAQRLPGIMNNDFSAQFVVRGGEQNEVLIDLDGLQLYEPFHLKDIDGGAISIVDVSAVEGVELLPGGYPANYGNRMSGVFSIRTTNPAVQYTRMSAGLSATHARILGEGSFSGNRGTWLVSGRRGYLDLVLSAIGEEDQIRPNYYDLFGKFQYNLSSSQLLTLSLLTAHDNLKYEGSAEDEHNNFGDTLYSSYGNSYAWLTLHSYFPPGITGRNIISVGKVDRDREGQIFDAPRGVTEMAVDEERDFSLFGLKSDWDFEVHSNVLLRAGLEYKLFDADYAYLGRDFDYLVTDYGQGPVYELIGVDSNRVDIAPDGDRFGAYLSNRLRFLQRITTEIGVRYDNTSYTGDANYSPRANLAVDLGAGVKVKFGWGHYYQSQLINELSVQDGVTAFSRAERADHFVTGVEYVHGPGKEIRLNAFYKKYRNLRPAYRNTFGELVTFPELEEDRIRVEFDGKRAYGIECYFINDEGGRLGWWLSYTLSRVEEDFVSIYYPEEDIFTHYDRTVPFLYDQLHTLYLDMVYRVAPGWQINLAWQYHTGWPTTDVYAEGSAGDDGLYLIADEPWEGQLDPYSRIDVRLNRKFRTSRGTLTAYIEVINVLNHDNVRNYEYALVPVPGGYSLSRDGENWFGIMPSFGLVYDFNL